MGDRLSTACAQTCGKPGTRKKMAADSSSAEMDSVWNRALELLRANQEVTAQQLSFIRLIKPLAIVEDNVFLAVAEDFTKNYVETTIRGIVTAALGEVLGREVRIAVTVDSSVKAPEPSQATDTPPARQAPEPAPEPAPAYEDPHLNPRYTFDTFVIGSSNRFAHAAAL